MRMIPKTIGLTVLFAIALADCGGGGSGSSVTTLSNPPQVQDAVPLSSCPAGNWFQYTDSGGATHPMNCVAADLTGCPNAQDLGFT